jgi:hypothetical protein
MTITINGTTGISGVDGSSATPAMQGADTNTGISYGTDTVTINTGGTARVTTDASGNVGVGTSSPDAKLEVIGNYKQKFADGNSQGFTVSISGATDDVILSNFYNAAMRFETNNTERMRIDSNGNLLVGTTGNGNNVKFVVDGGSQAGGEFRRNSTGSLSQVLFVNPNGVVGQISTSGSSTSFTTSSDYRLKENVAPMTGALTTVAALKPCTYTWKVDGSVGQGFLAHELQAVVPDCVTGEKDAVETVDDLDAEGRKIGTKEVPRYQGVDTSFLVATLVAAIQELKSEFDAYKATHP